MWFDIRIPRLSPTFNHNPLLNDNQPTIRRHRNNHGVQRGCLTDTLVSFHMKGDAQTYSQSNFEGAPTLIDLIPFTAPDQTSSEEFVQVPGMQQALPVYCESRWRQES